MRRVDEIMDPLVKGKSDSEPHLRWALVPVRMPLQRGHAKPAGVQNSSDYDVEDQMGQQISQEGRDLFRRAYAIFTSPIFSGPVAGSPSVTRWEYNPTGVDALQRSSSSSSSSSSKSLSLSQALLRFAQPGSSSLSLLLSHILSFSVEPGPPLHSNPGDGFRGLNSCHGLKDQV